MPVDSHCDFKSRIVRVAFDLFPRPSAYSSGADLPDPLFPEDKESFDLCPWRTFLSRFVLSHKILEKLKK